MCIITAYLNKDITMFEYDTEEEAREAYEKIKGYKIILKIIVY
ncbi:hypothetical protein [Robertmurraya korlensis]|nr:hypothetical protein [Robertmurraya korlensis]